MRRPKARSPEDRLCRSSSWNDDGTGAGHDFPGSYHFLTFLVHVIVAVETLCQDLFGGVVYAGLDTDKYKYPIGDKKLLLLVSNFGASDTIFAMSFI